MEFSLFSPSSFFFAFRWFIYRHSSLLFGIMGALAWREGRRRTGSWKLNHFAVFCSCSCLWSIHGKSRALVGPDVTFFWRFWLVRSSCSPPETAKMARSKHQTKKRWHPDLGTAPSYAPLGPGRTVIHPSNLGSGPEQHSNLGPAPRSNGITSDRRRADTTGLCSSTGCALCA